MAKSRAQQAAIAISMKKAGKSPKKKMLKGGRSPYMERMRTYQAGGLSTTAMYGDPRMADQLVQNIVYQESENQEALEREAEMAAQEDAQARMEAEQELARQYNIGNTIESTAQTALQQGAKLIINSPEAKAAAAKAGSKAFTPIADISAEAGTDAVSKAPGALGKFGTRLASNAKFASKVSPYAIAGTIAGQGIKYLSDDQDPTTMNFGEGAGGVISGASSGLGLGAFLGPAGAVAGGVIGGLYGLGKGLYQRGQARRTIGDLEQEQEDRMANLGARMRAEGVKSRTYSGYDFGRTLAKKGGPRMYQTAGFDMSMLANNSLPSAYITYLNSEPNTATAAPKNTIMNRIHKFAQNPVTEIQRAANMTPGGVTGRNTMDYAVDLINLPGAVSKVVQGASKGDPTKTAAGFLQAIPYAKPIAKAAGAGARLLPGAEVVGAEIAALENAGVQATNAYKTFADKTLMLGKDPSKYAMKGIVKNAPVSDNFTTESVQNLSLDPRLSGVTAQESTKVDMPMYTFKAGGVKLPGGTMKPIPGSDAVEFKGKSHKQGGILLDEQTEVEGGETMDKVTMKNGGPSDYFFSKYLKLGGKSYAQRHKDILKKGGSQQDIDALAKSQEMAAGRNPGVVEMETGGVKMYQQGGLPLLPYPDDTGNLPVMYDRQGNPMGGSMRDYDPTIYSQSQPYSFVPFQRPDFIARPSFDLTPVEVEDKKEEKKPSSKTTSKTTPVFTFTEEDEEQVMLDNEQEAMANLQPLPTIDTSPAAKGKSSNDDLIMQDVDAKIANLEDKKEQKEQIKLTKQEERALRRMYNDVPMSAKIAGAAQLIPAMYAFSRKEAAQKLMGPAGRIGSPDLQRADYNNERMQNASANRAMGRFIETSGGGPANIISKMAAYSKKQAGDMQIASAEQRANAAIQAEEAEMAQRADIANLQNALAVDEINTQMIEAQRVADENRKYMAIDAAASRGAGFAGDVMSYKADERLARSLGTMGIYERERLGRSLLGKVNPRTGKVYTKADIAKIYNINLDDPGITKEAEAAKNKAKG